MRSHPLLSPILKAQLNWPKWTVPIMIKSNTQNRSNEARGKTFLVSCGTRPKCSVILCKNLRHQPRNQANGGLSRQWKSRARLSGRGDWPSLAISDGIAVVLLLLWSELQSSRPWLIDYAWLQLVAETPGLFLRLGFEIHPLLCDKPRIPTRHLP